jgi:acyl-CoA dehydrogenase
LSTGLQSLAYVRLRRYLGAMIDFQPSEEQLLMRDAVAQFARASLRERVREVETSGAVPEDIRRAAHEMALASASIPEACGGQGLGLVTGVLLEEEIAAVDAASACALPGPGAFGTAVVELGGEVAGELLAPFFGADAHGRYGALAWSEERPHPERPGMVTVARREGDGWVLQGKKSHVIAAGLADRFVVVAQEDEGAGWNGLGAFVVEGDAPGVTRGERHKTLGLDAVWFGDVGFEGTPARRIGPAAGEAMTAALLRVFCKRALLVAARAVGLASGAFELAREYCDTRVAFGKPIGHFQAVAFILADRLMDVESARWLVWEAAWSWDSGQPEKDSLLKSAQAAAHALDIAMVCADDCVSLHGGMGFIRDAIPEKLMRDAKQLALCSPTSETLDQLAAVLEIGAPLDPALVLPTPELQTIFT